MPRRFGRICRAGEPKKSRSSSAEGGPAAVGGCAVFRRKPETEERPGARERFSARRPGCIRRRRVRGGTAPVGALVVRNADSDGPPSGDRTVCFKEFPPCHESSWQGGISFSGECGRATECGGCKNIRTMYGHKLLTFRCVDIFFRWLEHVETVCRRSVEAGSEALAVRLVFPLSRCRKLVGCIRWGDLRFPCAVSLPCRRDGLSVS